MDSCLELLVLLVVAVGAGARRYNAHGLPIIRSEAARCVAHLAAALFIANKRSVNDNPLFPFGVLRGGGRITLAHCSSADVNSERPSSGTGAPRLIARAISG